MANSSDWIAQFGAQFGAHSGAHSVDKSGAKDAPPGAPWLAALTLDEDGAPGGFRDVSPFAAPAPAPGPQPPAQDPLSEPVPEGEADEDPEAKAFARGFAEGHDEATRAGEASLAAERERLRDVRMAFRTLDAQALEALAQDLNATVLELCRQILRDYALDHEVLEDRCRRAAKRLGAGPSQAVLHLNPATLAALDPEAFADWTLCEDPSLPQEAVRVINQDGSARDGLDDWMRALAEGLGG